MRCSVLLLALVFLGSSFVRSKFLYDPHNTNVDKCVILPEKNDGFELKECKSTTIAVQFSKRGTLFLYVGLYENQKFTFSINGVCEVSCEGFKNATGGYMKLGDAVISYGDENLIIGPDSVTTVCNNSKLLQEADADHFWTTIRFERQTEVGGAELYLAQGVKVVDFGEYRGPGAPTKPPPTTRPFGPAVW
ncbi:hypothetical protein M3Y99_00250200 [Aphelenchoides fujianensis]|nr:hypothetical protein M3Y99_00250200 [Aphelenchoides fujianensis]